MSTPKNNSLDILRVSTKSKEELDATKARIDSLKLWAQGKAAKKIESDKELFFFMLDYLESESNSLSRSESNKAKIVELINKQIEINKNDKQNITLGDKIVFFNKRRITPAWVQKQLGCSYNPVKEWFDNPNNIAMLDKHHKACKIDEHHNRVVDKALKFIAKNPLNQQNQED
jgi:hypothetical protein